MNKKLLILPLAAGLASQAYAFQIDTGDDWQVRWDNTFKLNLMSRVAKSDKEVYTEDTKPGVPWFLADDSTLSVDRSGLGIVSTRFDIFSEFDVIFKRNYGFRVSASGWYDHAYRDSDHPSKRRFTWASPSVDPGEYPDDTDDLHYFGGEILDAFAFANFDIGTASVGVRAGRHTIYWGNGLLTGGAINGMAGAMAPLDISKAFGAPGTEAKELFIPSGKISTVIQLTDNATLNAYYGFEHVANRVPATGSYFSPAEGLTEDTEFVTAFPGEPRAGVVVDDNETDDGDFGINFQYFFEEMGLETSLIYINYTDNNIHGLIGGVDFGQATYAQAAAGDTTAQQLLAGWLAGCTAGLGPCPNQPDIDSDAGTVGIGRAKWLYKNDIDLYGISFAKEIAGVSVGMDIVHRRDTAILPALDPALQQFVNIPDFLLPLVEPLVGGNVDYDGADSDNFLAPTGDTWHVVINGLGFLNDNGFWEGGTFIVEADFTMLTDFNSFEELADPKIKKDRVVSNVGIVFAPTWYQVFPGWDLTVPMSVSYTIDGEKHPLTFGGDEHLGNGSVGFEFLINETWTFQAKYNVFFGPVDAGLGGLLKDRDNISLTLKRTM